MNINLINTQNNQVVIIVKIIKIVIIKILKFLLLYIDSLNLSNPLALNQPENLILILLSKDNLHLCPDNFNLKQIQASFR